ncbi:MAG: diaminopimelate decarboxylase, partial [Deltaproteobacteria bacterium]|nr:diaminopimelate decarboxylase [Deltaproteobacteria bacterium]
MSIEKQRYERPSLVRHQMGLMNKFSRVQAMKPQTHIDGVAVDELVSQYGSPVFVFSEKTLVDRYQELYQAFARRYPRVRIAWSYKTNYLESICKTFHSEGAWAEVVSGFELDKALGHGIPGDHIHFNGPYKPKDVLRKALRIGTIVHIDHFDELADCEAIADELGVRPKVALRINFRTEATPHWGRFGFNLESGQAKDAIARLVAGDKLDLIGLHAHMGTFILEPNAYKDAAKKFVGLANEIRKRYQITLSFLDFGGGFASPNTLKAQYLPGSQATPAFSRYAEALTAGLTDLDYAAEELPTIVLETGRALVDEAGFLITAVHANKRLSDGRRAVVLDAGVNTLFTSFWYKHEVVPAQALRGTPEPTVFFGPLCMNIDVVRDTMLFPPLRQGDHVVFRTVGAYNVTQWMQFITYRPA